MPRSIGAMTFGKSHSRAVTSQVRDNLCEPPAARTDLRPFSNRVEFSTSDWAPRAQCPKGWSSCAFSVIPRRLRHAASSSRSLARSPVSDAAAPAVSRIPLARLSRPIAPRLGRRQLCRRRPARGPQRAGLGQRRPVDGTGRLPTVDAPDDLPQIPRAAGPGGTFRMKPREAANARELRPERDELRGDARRLFLVDRRRRVKDREDDDEAGRRRLRVVVVVVVVVVVRGRPQPRDLAAARQSTSPPPLGHPPTPPPWTTTPWSPHRHRRVSRPLRVPGGGGAPTSPPSPLLRPAPSSPSGATRRGASRAVDADPRAQPRRSRARPRRRGPPSERPAATSSPPRSPGAVPTPTVPDARTAEIPSRRRLPYARDLRPELLHLRPRARARRRVPRAGARRRRHQRADDADGVVRPRRTRRDVPRGYKTPTGATTLAATAARRVDDADARGGWMSAATSIAPRTSATVRHGSVASPRCCRVVVVVVVDDVVVDDADRRRAITRRVRLDRGASTAHACAKGHNRHTPPAEAARDTTRLPRRRTPRTPSTRTDGAPRTAMGSTGRRAGRARGGAGRVGRDAARERERSGPRPRGGEDRGGHGVAATGRVPPIQRAFVNNRFEFESDKTNAAV